MLDGQEDFRARLERIKATETAAPLAPEKVADLRTLRRNASGVSFGDLTRELLAIPTVRIGLPIVIAAFAMAAPSLAMPQGMHKVLTSDEAFMEKKPVT